METSYLTISYILLWFFYMYLNMGTIAAAENRKILIPLFIKHRFFNKVLPTILLILTIYWGFYLFKWFLAILYGIIGILLFFFIDYWITQLYLKKHCGEFYNDYRVKLNFYITVVGYPFAFIFFILAYNNYF